MALVSIFNFQFSIQFSFIISWPSFIIDAFKSIALNISSMQYNLAKPNQAESMIYTLADWQYIESICDVAYTSSSYASSSSAWQINWVAL